MTDMDKSLLYPLVFSAILAVVGLATTYVGLAYHHHRRHHELLHAGHLRHPGNGVTSPPAGSVTAPPP